MGLFSSLSNMAVNSSLSTIEKAKRGRANYNEVVMAYEMLAAAGMLFKKNDCYSNENHMRNYFWMKGAEVENIDSDRYRFDPDKFTKVRKSECSNIDFRDLFG